MKCDDVKARLIEGLYGELPREEEDRLQEHLAGCRACRQEMEALEQSRRQLDVLREPEVRLDLGRLYRGAADRGQQSRRRWRRLAVAASAATVLVAALAAARLRVEWRPGQLTVSWGAKPPVAEPVRPKAVPAPRPRRTQYEERLEGLEEVTRLLAAELTASDVRQAAAMAELRRRLARWQGDVEELTRQSNLRWRLAERNIHDLYLLAQFSPDTDQKGMIP